MAAKDELGVRGERIAADFLVRNGFVVLARNWRCPAGEIDIVARESATVVVCEVKTRSSNSHGSAIEAVTAAKLARLRGLAAQWLADWDGPCTGVRVDLLGVSRLPVGAGYCVEHVRGVA